MKNEYLELFEEIANDSNWSSSEKDSLHQEISYKSKLVGDVIKYFYPFAKIDTHNRKKTIEEIELGLTAGFVGANYYFLTFNEDDVVLEICIVEQTKRESYVETEKKDLYTVLLNTLYYFIESMQLVKNDFSINIPKNNSNEQFANRKRKIDSLIS